MNVLQYNFQTPKIFIPTGSNIEKTITDSYLRTCLGEMAKNYPNCKLDHKFRMSNCWFSGSIDPEPVLLFETDSTHLIILGTATKGLEASNEKTYIQTFLLLANAAVELRRLGLPTEACVVAGICYSGEGFRFVAVYLVEEFWPVFVILSQALHPLEDSELIAHWMFNVFDFAGETAEMYDLLLYQFLCQCIIIL